MQWQKFIFDVEMDKSYDEKQIKNIMNSSIEILAFFINYCPTSRKIARN